MSQCLQRPVPVGLPSVHRVSQQILTTDHCPCNLCHSPAHRKYQLQVVCTREQASGYASSGERHRVYQDWDIATSHYPGGRGHVAGDEPASSDERCPTASHNATTLNYSKHIHMARLQRDAKW
jgi:hypothetical protein